MIFTNSSKPVLSFVYSNKNKAVNQAKRIVSNLQANLEINITE